MNILLLGSGGREHALAWKLSQSPLLSNLFIAPGNAGTSSLGSNLSLTLTDFGSIRLAVIKHRIDMVVVGPEDPLVNGIHDFFLADHALRHIPVIGPVKQGAMLEGSKDFAKQFMNRHGIPTARHRTFDKLTIKHGVDFLHTLNPPFVLKADGLASGKGVIICETCDDAVREFTHMIQDSRFGAATNKVVIEEFLSGTELSVFILTDGVSYRLIPEAKDYKKIGAGDTGLNTGGMGSISPVPFADEIFMQKVEQRVIIPTIQGLFTEGIEYTGFIFFGLINVNGDPFVIEYNCRLGDPETESVIPRLKNDLVQLFMAVAGKSLHKETISVDPLFAASVMLVSAGYPGAYEKGKYITGEEKISDSMIFHAGTGLDHVNGRLVTTGGRVMAVTTMGVTMQEALAKGYQNIEKINFEGKTFRNDIGFDLS
ncbi:MAG: phosphoribosylamine--glycine ligase [Bacteroidales bacterium]|nr:phosphoribosylamine--glycine ligase [Bacteroidales bacterium]